MENRSLKNWYTYGAFNRLEKAVNADGFQASYQYNCLGYRTGKSIRGVISDPEKQVRYTIDLTRQYHNLLEKEEKGEILSFLWDNGIAGMRRTRGIEEEGRYPGMPEYYLQDDLGSPIRLLSGSGELTESYGYDEFGRDLYGNQGKVQPFGYTGYQYDRISDTYFAQAREYVPNMGRFAGQDIIKGFTEMPYSLNGYGYCWGNPLIWVDLNGENPSGLEETDDDIYYYDRDAAISYAEEWSNSMLGWNTAVEAVLGKMGIGRNSEYYSYSTNCANFVSQCLYAGGIEKNSEWYSYKSTHEWVSGSGNSIIYYDTYDVSAPWRLAQEQYNYFSNVSNGYINGDTIKITSVNEMVEAVKLYNIQKGDLMYFINEAGDVHHATIISEVGMDKIYYSGNTRRRYNEPLENSFENGGYGVYVIRMKDELVREERGDCEWIERG